MAQVERPVGRKSPEVSINNTIWLRVMVGRRDADELAAKLDRYDFERVRECKVAPFMDEFCIHVSIRDIPKVLNIIDND